MTALPTPRPVAAPYAHGGPSTPLIMVWVMVALTPATVFGLGLYGWPAIGLFAVTLVSALATEAACTALARRPVAATLADGSAVLTGWILALSLPPWAPWWLGATGGVLAIAVGKQVFGGLGQNPFNPAMAARVALLVAFPQDMTRYVRPLPIFLPGSPGFADGLGLTFGLGTGLDIDAMSSASILGFLKTELGLGHGLGGTPGPGMDALSLFLGTTPGSLGETSALLLLLGGGLLLALRIVGWQTPAALMLGIVVPAAICHGIAPGRYLPPLTHLLAASTIFGAFFIATDPVTSPVTRTGQAIFGAGCGVLIFAIRTWGGYPEGMAFAILLMNAATPLIDRWIRPRIYGRDRKGRPLPLTAEGRR